MLRAFCDICAAKIPNNDLTQRFCPRCAPLAERFLQGQRDIINKAANRLSDEHEKFRNQFVKENIGKSELKAVSSADQRVAG